MTLLLVFYYYLLLIHRSYELLCYNGTLNNKLYGEDPLETKHLFNLNTKHMKRLRCSLSISCKAYSLLCYNCSSTQRSWNHCGGDFIKPYVDFNNSRLYLINCTKENSMCFVRSWRARDRHAWIVQRGCYQVNSEDIIPRAMNTPTRAMTCKLERLANAQYKTCLCNADWCNSANLCEYSLNYIFNKVIYLVHVYAYADIL